MTTLAQSFPSKRGPQDQSCEKALCFCFVWQSHKVKLVKVASLCKGSDRHIYLNLVPCSLLTAAHLSQNIRKYVINMLI